MSDYIMHSSGTWKNHKWIRREGSPGNYKYYYKNSDSDSSGSSKKYTDDPDYNPSTPYTNQYKDKNGKKHGTSTGSGTADTVRDTAYGTAGKSNYYGNQKLDSKKRARDIAELKRRAMGDQYRRDQVNRMINAMSGKTVTQFVSNVYHEKLDPVHFHSDIVTGRNLLKETNKVTKIVDHYKGYRNYNGKKKYQQQQETARKVREEQSSKKTGNEVKFVGGYRARYEGKKANQELKNKQSKYYYRYAR